MAQLTLSGPQLFNQFLANYGATLSRMNEGGYNNFISDARNAILATAREGETFIPLEFAQKHAATKDFDVFRKPRSAATTTNISASQLSSQQLGECR